VSPHQGKCTLTQRASSTSSSPARWSQTSELSVTTGTVNHAAILAPFCRLAWMRSQATPHTSGAQRSVGRILTTPPLAA